MTIKNFFVDPLSYKNSVKNAILKLGGEFVDISRSPNVEIYHVKKTGVTIAYDPKNGLAIVGKVKGIEETHSGLEKLSLPLIEFEGRQK